MNLRIAKNKIPKIRRKISLAVFIILLFIFSLAFANRHKIVYGMRIADVSVGGLTMEKVQEKISKATEEFFEKDIILRHKNDKTTSDAWTAKPEELGIKIDVESTLDSAYRIGHQKNIFLKFGKQVLAFFGYYNLRLNYDVNEIELESFIAKKLDSINNPAVNAGWQYNEKNKKFVRVASQEGKIIERENFKLQLYKKIEKFTNVDIYLNLVPDYPEVLENETEEAYKQAQKILANVPYRLIVNDPLKIASSQILLTKTDLISLIEFVPVNDKNNSENKVLGVNLNKEALASYLAAIGPLINRDPINARLKIVEDKVIDFSLSRDGLKLEIEKNIAKLREEILDKGNKNINLEISIVPPKIATKDINNLGITALIGKGTSNFAGSPKNRIHNIDVGAAKFNGVLIKPEEEFSFNTILGEVGPEQGYKAELVIKRDKTIPEYGGGLCQVSTTAFRAAFNTGLPIKERQAHAFPVKYYSPQGFDATIYPPHPDLRFVNNTPGHILIQTKINGNELTFEFYGTDDGRRVEVEGPYQYDIKSDGSMKAKLIRRIYDKDGNFVLESVFNSNYKSPSLYPVDRNPLE